MRLGLTRSAWGSDISGSKDWELFEAQRLVLRSGGIFRNRYLRPAMGNVVGWLDAFILRENAFWELLFRASPAAILGWVARAVISPGRGRTDIAPHFKLPPTWGAHNHTEEKVEEGREVGFSVRRGGVGESLPGSCCCPHPPACLIVFP